VAITVHYTVKKKKKSTSI